VRKKKIAILGGGIGSLVTAYYLTRTPELRSKHDVTIYQMGWRLGGKCASGRSLVPSEGKRIEEHGLHLWFGFYQNAFATIQEIYAKKPVRADDRLVSWRDGFRPCSYTPLGEGWLPPGPPPNPPGSETLDYWPVVWPQRDGVPGDGDEPSAMAAILGLSALIKDVLVVLRDTTMEEPSLLGRIVESVRAVESTAVHAAIEMLEDFVADTPLAVLLPKIPGLAEVAVDLRAELRADAAGKLGDATFRRLFSVLDIAVTTFLGMLDPKYGIVQSDFELDLDAIDDYEYRDWLLENGGDEWVVKKSPYLRALYDLPFAYDEGDVAKPGLGAGTAIRILLRIVLHYREAAFFEMTAGMGEVVIAPFYEVLREQGVKVELFHKVTRLELSPDKRWIERVHFDRQVDVIGGTYEPTFREGGVTCWPSEPLWSQIVNGAAIRAQLDAKKSSLESHWCDVPPAGTKTIALGVDFDQVVLGIALAAFKPLNALDPGICDELLPESPRFGAMVKGLAIVPTQSFQIWTKKDLAGLGWREPRASPPAMNGAPEPFSVWADCSHVLPREAWPAPRPEGVFYFCGPWKNALTAMPRTTTTVPADARAEVEANAIDWLERYTGYMWPDARDPGNPAGLDWNALHDPTGAVGSARMRFQVIRPNVDPTECVEASLPGTTKLRLKADESGFENLFLAGAWLRTGINATCVEAAVMSGMDCARAISGEPLEIAAEWFCMKKPARFR
jgi:uncharacterized protein with NAD-binding domain and iron-sulfur cluster